MVKHNLYTKIFRQLRGYFISPHLNVWMALRKRLFSKNFPDNTSRLKDYRKDPPPELFEQVLNRHQQMYSRFSELQQLEQAPDPVLFENIVTRIYKEEQLQRPKEIPVIPLYKKMIAAAAMFLLLISCFFLLNTGNNKNNNQPGIAKESPAVVAPDTLLIKDSMSIASPERIVLVAGNHVNKPRRRFFSASNFLSFYNVNIGNTSLSLEENDLLYSFAKYPYRFGEPNPWNKSKGTVIRINSYSSINVSPYMSSVIAELYKVKANGKPTAKAKKAKAKINRWRKTDSKKFDRKKNKNPLDIIDLGENVF